MEKLGINGIQLLAQLVNVGILLFVLKKFLYKPMLHILEKRKALVQEIESKEAEYVSRLSELEKKEKELTKHAKVHADQLAREAIHEAKKTAASLVKEAEEKAAKRRDQLLKSVEADLAHAKNEMDQRISEEAVKLANTALMSILPDETRVKLTQAQVAKFLTSRPLTV